MAWGQLGAAARICTSMKFSSWLLVSCKREMWANTSSIGARHLIDSCKDRNKSANQKEAVDEKVEETSQGQLTGILFNPERKLKSIAC
jgi:hypothetical protein